MVRSLFSSQFCVNRSSFMSEPSTVASGQSASEPVPIEEQPPAEPISFAEFLESRPPGQQVAIKDLCVPISATGNGTVLASPELLLHCTDERCNGPRVFRTEEYGTQLSTGKRKLIFISYFRSNCRRVSKTFSLILRGSATQREGTAYKFGEVPTFGPPTPTRLITLIGGDRDTFLKGRTCENQGLGIGAFIYYRRVVENQKNRILGEIKRVAEKIGAPTEAISALNAALKETRFSRAVELVKSAIPESLLINGHNPLLLLHSELSESVHEGTDEGCLVIAQAIRTVLIELSDRLGQALKDETELKKAVGALTRAKQKPTSSS